MILLWTKFKRESKKVNQDTLKTESSPKMENATWISNCASTESIKNDL